MADLVEDRLQRIVVIGRGAPRPARRDIDARIGLFAVGVIAGAGIGTAGVVGKEEIHLRGIGRGGLAELDAQRRPEHLEGLADQEGPLGRDAIGIHRITRHVVEQHPVVGVDAGVGDVVIPLLHRAAVAGPVARHQVIGQVAQRRGGACGRCARHRARVPRAIGGRVRSGQAVALARVLGLFGHVAIAAIAAMHMGQLVDQRLEARPGRGHGLGQLDRHVIRQRLHQAADHLHRDGRALFGGLRAVGGSLLRLGRQKSEVYAVQRNVGIAHCVRHLMVRPRQRSTQYNPRGYIIRFLSRRSSLGEGRS